MFNYYIAFTNTLVSSTKDAHKTTYTKGQVKLKHVTSPPKKKSRIIFRSSVADLEKDEEWTYSDEIGGGGGRELNAITTHGSIEEELEPNLGNWQHPNWTCCVYWTCIIHYRAYTTCNFNYIIIPTCSTCSWTCTNGKPTNF